MSLYRHTIAIAISLLLAACGFQLRDEPNIPAEMSRIYIATNDNYSLFYRKLRNKLKGAGVEVVDSPANASAVFSILRDDTDQRVLSVSARNVPREFEVYYSVSYSVENGEESIMAPQSLTLTRDYTYDETLVLGKAKFAWKVPNVFSVTWLCHSSRSLGSRTSTV